MKVRRIALAALLAGTTALAEPPATIPIERSDMLGGRPFHGNLPVVRASIEGKEGLFLFDTGASDTVLSPAFAAQLPIAPGQAMAGRDSGGNAVGGRHSGPVRISFTGGATRTLERTTILAMPSLEALGLAGVISPQTLAGTSCILIDFPANRATLADAGDALCTQPDPLATPGDAPLNRRPALTAGPVGSQDSTRFLLDSGATRSKIPARFAPSAQPSGTATSQGVAGVATNAPIVGAISLAVGRQTITIDAPALAAPGAVPILGFDILRRARIRLRAAGQADIAFPN